MSTPQPVPSSLAARVGGIVLLLLGVAVIVSVPWWGPDDISLRVWMSGAGALGLLSGFTTGFSSRAGSGSEFLKFLGAGILVPLIGGSAALIARAQDVDAQLESAPSADPLIVLGSFFLVFGLVAILGILSGVLLRRGGLPPIMAA
jgi:hypothetical protein